MKQKKIKSKEGDVFAVPLKNGKYAIGLIAREYKKMTLGYFFNGVYDNIPLKVEQSVFAKSNIALIGKFSSIGIEDSEWPLLEANFSFIREEWPIPLFKMQEPITKKYYAVVYEENLLNESRYLISESDAAHYFAHGLYGYLALSNTLSKILKADA